MATAKRSFGQVQILAGQRRNDNPQGLWYDNEIKRLRTGKPHSCGGFALAPVDRLDTRPHNLGNERGRVQAQRQQQRNKFGNNTYATAKVKAPQDRHIELERNSGNQIGRQQCQQEKRARRAPDRHDIAGRHQHLTGAAFEPEKRPDTDNHGEQIPHRPRTGLNGGQHEPSIVQKYKLAQTE